VTVARSDPDPTGFLLGVDGGSQSTKVVLYALDGRAVCQATAPLRPLRMPRPGVAEHPDDDLWDSLVTACRSALARLVDLRGDDAPTQIRGIGLCTIRCCRAVLDAAGELAAPVQSWMDARSTLPHQPAGEGEAYVTTSSGYLTHRLTGRFRDTAANYVDPWPIDPVTWAWSADDAAIAAAGLRRGQLLELVLPAELLGEVTREASSATGLPAGVPVFATANDKAVEALGSGITGNGTVLLSLGTYIAAMVAGRVHLREPRDFWVNFACVPGGYLFESRGIRRGMWTVSWLRELFGDQLSNQAAAAGLGVEELLERAAAAVPPGSDGLMTVLDWLAPPDVPHRKGSMLGFDARHGWAHLYRSILEGIAMTMAGRVQAMSAELGHQVELLVAGGGGAHSDLMTQILADVFAVPVARMEAPSGASLGSAICAAVGLGVYPDVTAATWAMVHRRDLTTPDAERAAFYARIGAVYRSIQARTDPVYEQLYPIVH
jgi:sugar (pentulose or hexulose) kinase